MQMVGRCALVTDKNLVGDGRTQAERLVAIIYLRRRRPSPTLSYTDRTGPVLAAQTAAWPHDYQRVTLLLADREDLSAYQPLQQPSSFGTAEPSRTEDVNPRWSSGAGIKTLQYHDCFQLTLLCVMFT